MTKLSFLSISCILSSLVAFAQPSPYELDSAYGQYGISRPNTCSPTIYIHQFAGSALQADGKLVLAGTGNFQSTLELVRLDTLGALDTSFNHTGFLNTAVNGTYPWTFNNIRILSTGDIIVAATSSNPGNVRLTSMCFRPNGTLRTTYGVGGKADVGTSVAGIVMSLTAMDAQADDKVVLAGGGPGGTGMPYKYVLARLKTNGTLDTSFGVNGLVHCPYFPAENRNAPIYAMKVQADGKIVCVADMTGSTGGADTLALIRYKTNGTLDTAFGTNGLVKYPQKFRPGAVNISATGEIYLMGTTYSDTFFIKKFNATGGIVSGFGTGGTVTVGTLFGSNFIDTGNLFQYYGRFALLGDGKMVIGGSSTADDTCDYRVCRLMPDGSRDTVFAPNGTITVPHAKPDMCNNILVQADDKILLTGYTRFGLGTGDTCMAFVMRFRDTAKTAIPPTVIAGTSHLFDGVVYPNPTNDGAFSFRYTNAAGMGQVKYTVSNTAGQAILNGSFDMPAGNGTMKIDLGKDLPDGVYVLQLFSAQGVGAYKLLMRRE